MSDKIENNILNLHEAPIFTANDVLKALPNILTFHDLNNINDVLKKMYNKIHVRTLFSERIGHLAMNTEIFLRRLHENAEIIKENKELYLLVNTTDESQISNKQLYSMIKRVFPVIDSKLLLIMIQLLSGLDHELWDYPAGNSSVLNANNCEFHEFNDITPRLSFSKEDHEKGQQLLNKIGVEKEKPFICIHSRDGKYLSEKLSTVDWSYHNHRDCSIKNYIPAAEYLAEQGNYVLRMGEIVTEEIKFKNEKIIDYSKNYRTDFGDAYLPANCKFFLGNTAGLFLIATIFGVPTACANFTPYGLTNFLAKDLFIPKKYWYIPEKRFLGIRELIESNMDKWGDYGHNYHRLGIEVIENSADEILAMAKEMNQRIDGTWVATEEDEELQARFKSLFKPSMRCYGFPCRIGSQFLRENKELLE